MTSTNTTIGQEILESRGLNFDGYLFWISLGALFGFTIVFNIGYILALSYLKCKFFAVVLFQLETALQQYMLICRHLINIQLLDHLVLLFRVKCSPKNLEVMIHMMGTMWMKS